MLRDALLLGLGYNAALVTVGAALLGAAAGITGTYLLLRKRALISDAVSHATLPGLALAFLALVALGGDGRSLPWLLAGSAASAVVGLVCVQALTARTRLPEDAAIGAVLSVFFGFGVVLLTVIQSVPAGRQAGLDSFLLGSTAGMLRGDALLIAFGGAAVVAMVWVLRRPFTAVCFDPDYAVATGVPLRRVDFAIMALATAVTVIGLKIVGLILIVALLIIPPVTARFWTDRAGRMVLVAGLFGAAAAYLGAAISASAPDLPTGPVIVLVAFGLFVLSLVAAPVRGVLAGLVATRRFRDEVHLRQGLLALSQGQPVYEPFTRRLLQRRGLLRPDGVATEAGLARAALAGLNEHRWAALRQMPEFDTVSAQYDGLREVSDVLTADQLADLDRRLGGPRAVPT